MLRTNVNSQPTTRLKGDFLWEKAAMCAYVYGDFELPDFINGYQLYNTSIPGPSDQGYYGVCFITVDESSPIRTVDIVFAHRGTIFNFQNLLDDLRIAMGYAPEVYKVALKYVTTTINAIAKKYGAANIEYIDNTGHSLGGLLSDLVTLKLASSMSSHYQFASTTFENPGAKAATEQLIRQKDLPASVLPFAKDACWNFSNDINVINCCQEQVGTNNALLPRQYRYFHDDRHPSVPKSSSCVTNPYYLLSYVADQHSIIKTYESVREEADWESEVTYPVGLKNAYKAYLNYSERKSYWNDYMKIVWDTDAKLRDQFNGVYKNYVSYFIDNLRSLREQAVEMIKDDQFKMVSPGLFGLFTKKEKYKDDISFETDASHSVRPCVQGER